ncbi:MAG: DEAD/DEAH box helicase, partial [Actinomycetota bacterium]|nr:DEAD/DEAH box helicase [Actinomycetota bacterium]
MSSSFADLGVPAALSTVLSERHIDEPFPIQAATLPDALAGRDVSGRAPTGSGKTLAFAIPAVVAAKAARGGAKRSPAGSPFGLILVPTRELAAQVQTAIEPLAAVSGLRVTSIYGGVGYGGQRAALRKGVDIVVACPGRLEDLVAQGDVNLAHVGLVVVDEADRMADMGFLPAVRRLLDATRKDRQSLLFSATLDGEVDVLVKRYQHHPRRHEVVADHADASEVHHVFWKAPTERRVALTAEVVAAHAPAIIFCRTRHGSDRLVKRLAQAGVSAAPIHGARSQPQRDRALAAFKGGAVQALVATDVAARGIHVDAVACVVHYDLPADSKDYVHRSGRTGRAGADGVVVSMVGPDQAKEVRTLQRQLGYAQELITPDPSALPASAPFVPHAEPAEQRRPQWEQRRPTGNGGPGSRRRASTGGARSHRSGSGGGGGGGAGRSSTPASAGRFRT